MNPSKKYTQHDKNADNCKIELVNAPDTEEEFCELTKYQQQKIFHHAYKHILNGVSGLDSRDFKDNVCQLDFEDLIPKAAPERKSKLSKVEQALVDKVEAASTNSEVQEYCKEHGLAAVMDKETLLAYSLHKSLGI